MLHKHNDMSIHQAALELCKKHGSAAESFATDQMHEFLERDDVKQSSYWMAVIHEIKSLSSTSIN